jgi:hypothetical protein
MLDFHPDHITPLEWSELWNAVETENRAALKEKREPRLIRTTANMFEEMLGCVPPVALSSDRFLVGEIAYHDAADRPVYRAFFQIGKEYGTRLATLREFRAL